MGAAQYSIPFRIGSGSGISVFAKSSAGGAEERRIGGLITTARRDRAEENVLQDTLDFSLIRAGEGYFIDEHDASAGAVVGVIDPESLAFYSKGEPLPDGRIAPNDGWWVEGSLLRSQAAARIWDVAQSLKDTGRELGFSADGRVIERTNGKKTIARAAVFDVAITRHPMNEDARLVVLAKSLEAARRGVRIFDRPLRDQLAKALTAGESLAVPEGPVAGDQGGMRVLAPEDYGRRRKRRKKPVPNKGQLTKALLDRWHWASARDVGRLVDALYEAKEM